MELIGTLIIMHSCKKIKFIFNDAGNSWEFNFSFYFLQFVQGDPNTQNIDYVDFQNLTFVRKAILKPSRHHLIKSSTSD